jgi:integrase
MVACSPDCAISSHYGKHNMMLKDFVTNIYSLERAVSKGHRNLILVKLRRYSSYLGHEATTHDLNAVSINRFLEHRESVVKNATVVGERAILRALWCAANEAEPDCEWYVPAKPARLRRLRREEVDVCGWDGEQLKSLLLATERQRGMFRTSAVGKVARAPFWRAFLLTAYDTGLRLGDMLRLTTEQVSAEGSLRIKQNKTGKFNTVWISKEASEAINYSLQLQPRRLVFGGVLTKACFHKAWRKMVRELGMRGGTKFIRRTSGSMIERARPGQGHIHLGNGANVFAKHYRVERLINDKPVLPPRIAVEGVNVSLGCGSGAMCG